MIRHPVPADPPAPAPPASKLDPVAQARADERARCKAILEAGRAAGQAALALRLVEAGYAAADAVELIQAAGRPARPGMVRLFATARREQEAAPAAAPAMPLTAVQRRIAAGTAEVHEIVDSIKRTVPELFA